DQVQALEQGEVEAGGKPTQRPPVRLWIGDLGDIAIFEPPIASYRQRDVGGQASGHRKRSVDESLIPQQPKRLAAADPAPLPPGEHDRRNVILWALDLLHAGKHWQIRPASATLQ